MGRLARQLRAISEYQLMIAAQRKVAAKYGTPAPPPPKGVDLFWQKVYVPIFYRLPYRLRSKVADTLPGSHRRTWTPQPPPQGPAV